MGEPWKLLPTPERTKSTEKLSTESPENGDIIQNNEEEEEEGDASPIDEEEGPSGVEKMKQDQFLKNLMTVLEAKCKEGNVKAHFLLGQLYFEQELYKEAKEYFLKVMDRDVQGMYQLGVMYFDGLGNSEDHTKGIECLIKVGSSKSIPYKHIIHVAQYCVGLAFFQGYGVLQSDAEAERWWTMAADNGHPKACVRAQSMLGMFYSLPDTQDFKKAFFWHSEACGNGNLESQGCLGVMYKFGIGVPINKENAFICLKGAASQGNVYAMGVLVCHYYECKMFTNAVHLAARLCEIRDFEQVAHDTDCLVNYIRKGVALAAFYLGRCLDRGSGIKKNIQHAQKYYQKSFETECQIYCDLVHRKHYLMKL